MKTAIILIAMVLSGCGDDSHSSSNYNEQARSKPAPKPTSKAKYIPTAPQPIEVIPSDEQSEADPIPSEIDAPSPTPTPPVDPINYELMHAKQADFDARFLARFNEINSWSLGDDWTTKENRMDSLFISGKDYIWTEFGTSEAEALKWRSDYDASTGSYSRSICGQSGVTVAQSELYITYADGKRAKIEIEMAVDDSEFNGSTGPLYISYIKITVRQTTDSAPITVIKSACGY